MIRTLMRVAWISLSRDRVAQAMTFLLPIMFFSIFANVFGRQQFNSTGRLPVAVVDEDHSEFSRRLARALENDGGLLVRMRVPAPRGGSSRPGGASAESAQPLLDRAHAEEMVRSGDLSIALVIPKGLTVAFGPSDSARPSLEILSDPSDPVAVPMIAGILQKDVMTAAPDVLMKSGLADLERFGGALTPQQRNAVNYIETEIQADSGTSASASGGSSDNLSGLVPVKVVKLLGEKRENPMISFYAAGIAIMFLLFSCSGAAGTLLDEVDSGTLDRVLTTRVGMGGLLAGKWIYLTSMGVAQIIVMFVYAMLVFGLPFTSHLPGFAVMAPISAAMIASFGLLLATAARTRQQLGGLSTIIILAMSALGGSMFPRFLMSAGMQKIGLFTPNAWALDGFVKVFWRDAKIFELWPQVAMLVGFTMLFLTTARLLARRWETA